MPDKCCVPTCRSNFYFGREKYTTVFKFPAETRRPDLRQKWILSIPRKNWIPTKRSVVCIKHFHEEDIITAEKFKDAAGVEHTVQRGRPALKPDAYPTVFPCLPSYLQTKPAQQRKDPKELNSSLPCLRAHLASFAPEYPIKKGYIAKLLMGRENRLSDIVMVVKTLVLTSQPDKHIDEAYLRRSIELFKSKFVAMKKNMGTNWSSLVSLFLEPFHLSVQDFPDSVAQESGPLALLASTPVQPPSCSNTSSSSVRSPSPKKMRRDCENCYTKMRTFLNLSKANVLLQQELKDLRKQYKKELAMNSQNGVNKLIKRKENSIAAWKSKYKSLKVCKNQLVMVHSKLQIALEEIKTLKEKEQEYKSRIEELQNILYKEHGSQIVENVDMLDPTETLRQEFYDETERNINGTYLAAEIKQEPDDEIPRNCEATVPDTCNKIKQELDYVITRNFDTPEPDQDEENSQELDHVITRNYDTPEPDQDEENSQELDHVVSRIVDTCVPDLGREILREMDYETVWQVEQHLPSHAKEIKQQKDYDVPVHFDLTNHTSMSAPATTACQSLHPPAHKSLLPPPGLPLLPPSGLSPLPPALTTRLPP